MFYLSLAILNYLLFYYPLSKLAPKYQKLPSFKYWYFFASLVFVSGELYFFFSHRETNIYEIHNRPRSTFNLTREEIMAKYEREKANKNTSRLTNDYEFEQYILDHNEFQLFYDKYGPIFLMAVKYLQSWRSAWIYVLEKHLFECFSFYFSLILPTIYVCKKYPYKRLKFLMSFLGIACFVLELEVTLQPFQADTLIDDYFPFLTAFEKVIMVKTTLICLLNAIVGYYAHIKRNKQMKIEEIFELIKEKNQKLFKPPPKRPKGKGDPSQIELGSIIEAIEPSMGKIQSYIEQEKQTNQTKKEKYNLLFYLIILSLLLNFIYNLPITQEYFIDLYKKSFVRENQSL